MLISNSKKFIFLHTWKTGGTSIKKALNSFSDNTSPFNNNNHFKHITAVKLRESLVDKNIFDQYFKFLFIRNPWDVQVSYYFYVMQKKDHFDHEFVSSLRSFELYLEWRIKPENKSLQKEFAFDKSGKCLVDFIGKFEEIDSEFMKICSILNLGKITLPRMNVSKHFEYRRYYSDYSANLVKEAYKEDIMLGNYQF